MNLINYNINNNAINEHLTKEDIQRSVLVCAYGSQIWIHT